ncbi:MAG: glycoside hydrolase family 97 catalytic domain-containing protein [FCB group bacterium]|nr:glycoside hydrolase family 97 catalytic domain-containing protein [FCB group bacterium]MBL7120382.1 glycoside hydrolase family 97 catalytic domain-containing protein [Candidatus Neomarinimicrobiota bacterium]
MAQARDMEIVSPDGSISARIGRDAELHLTLEVSRGRDLILHPSPMGIIIDSIDLGSGAEIITHEPYIVNESYDLLGGHSRAINHCTGSKIKIKTSGQTWTLGVRVFNDGVAFQYIYPNTGPVKFTGESTQFNFSKGLNAKYMLHKRAEESKIYTGKLSDFSRSKTKRTMPPLLLYSDDMSEYIMLLEAGGFDFHGYSLLPEIPKGNVGGVTSLKVDYAEAADGWDINGDIETAWKVLCIVNSLNELVNTDIVTNLCPEPDPQLFPRGVHEDWIKPGKSTWNWWARVKVDYEKQKELIDLAAQMGADYHLVDIGWDSKWGNEAKGAYDFLQDLCDYAGSKGIGIFVWKTSDVSLNLELKKADPKNKFTKLQAYDVSRNLDEMRTEVERIAATGAIGIKLDYINSENSQWKRYMEDFLKVAAENQLMVDFHGCPIPAGESRTYPNEVSREAIWGGEKLRGGGGARKMPTSHYIDQLFTRLIAGHADFTPGILNPEKGLGYTQAMQLAAAMMFTSPYLCWADHPDNYLASAGLDLIQSLPTTWDETLVLEGSGLSDLAVYARRKGGNWYVAGINGLANEVQKYDLNLNFLNEKKYLVTLYSDDLIKGSPDIVASKLVKRRGDQVKIKMLPSGGFIVRLTEVETPE